MKNLLISLIASLLVLPFLANAGAPTAKTPSQKKYVAYWIATSGYEKIVMNEANVPEAALVRDEKGVVVDLHLDVLDKALGYTYQNTIQGKEVACNKFVLMEEEAPAAETLHNDVTLGLWASCNQFKDDQKQAEFCMANILSNSNIPVAPYRLSLAWHGNSRFSRVTNQVTGSTVIVAGH